MYTRPAADLADTPRGREVQELLRSCVHCGFCLPACPTYRILGSELDSPRGRIYLVKQLVEGGPVSAATREHLDRCLTCRSCESACPSGVQYGRIIALGRELADEQVPRPRAARAGRRLLIGLLSRPALFTPLLRLGQAVRGLLPPGLRAKVPPRGRTGAYPTLSRARRVVLLEGCVQPGLAPQVNLAAARVLDRLGIGVVRIRGESCCGALPAHLSEPERSRELARRNIEALVPLLDGGAEAIVSTASGCGAHLKDYGHLLVHDPRYASGAARVANATRDLCELVELEALRALGPRVAAEPALIAWQSPCTLQHGQRTSTAGRVEALLIAAGYRLAPVANPNLCCGSAGTYSILQPKLSGQLRERKLATLLQGEPACIATANIGCLEHLRAASPRPVRHWIELIDAALGELPAP